MDIEPGGIYNNLEHWNWEISGSYKIKEPEAKCIQSVLRRFKPRIVREVNRGDWTHEECPECRTVIGTQDKYCPECGQRFERRRRA